MKTKKIFITGCARSGTTLLARMFHAFEDVSVVENECTLEDFTEYCSANEGHFRIIVGKRTERSIFSNVLSEEETQKQLKLIEDNDHKHC